MSTPTLSGPRFTLSAVPGSEIEPVVHALADGTFIAVWVESSATPIGPDTSGSAIRAGFFNAAGEPIGSTFQVNNLFDNNQVDPDITVLTGGRFLVTWSAAGAISGDGNGTAVKARIFAADGTPEGDEFQVNTYEINQQNNPSVTALDDGGFVVVYDSPLILGVLSFNVGAQFYNADGSPRGGEIKINATNNGTRNVDVEPLSNGNVVFVWDVFVSGSGQTDTSGRAVFARVMTASGGSVGGDILVNTTTDDVQQTPRVAALTGGGFVVTWSDNSQTGPDTSSFAIRAQVFSNAGAPVGGEFLVNTTTALSQITPVVTGLSDGRFIIAWTDQGNGSGLDIRARLYNADGTPSGDEVLVTGDINGNQVEPEITELSDGRVLVGWRNVSDLAGQVIDPREAAINSTGDAGDNIIYGTRFNDTVTGLGGADRLSGEGGNDTLLGGGGADRLDGGTGNDRLEGDLGNDIYIVDSLGDVVAGEVGFAQGGGIDTVFTSVDFTAPANVEIIRAAPGTAPLNLTGNDAADTLVGNDGANRLDGRGDNDNLAGNGGTDTLNGGDGTDTLNGGDGDDFIFGGATAADLRDVVFGGDGNDSIDGGAGNDELNGGNGNDTVLGGAGADTLVGNGDNDVLGGGAGSDLMSGNAGNDTLNGGFGFDRMNGGLGADSFFHQGVRDHGSDTIQDYNAAEGDVLAVGIAGATAGQFQVNFATTVGAGSASVQEAFVIYRPTGQILWALVDGADDTVINLSIGGQVFDLLL